ncbi:MAG: hypothetical protein KAX49_18160 [Halanaerobiales bacterium]|nr:hypothetical protein [Halanaerobiales bacterium]
MLKMVILYDANGNLVEKGNEGLLQADGSVEIIKDTDTAEYGEYEYTADNRLKAVYRNARLTMSLISQTR